MTRVVSFSVLSALLAVLACAQPQADPPQGELYSSCMRVETRHFESEGGSNPPQSAHLVCMIVVNQCNEEPAGALCAKLRREYAAESRTP